MNVIRYAFISLLGVAVLPIAALAHCDTINGPVAKAVRESLVTGNVDPVLIWIKQDKETEVREAFRQARIVRELAPEARRMADTYFLETVVRLHRSAEGAAYSGINLSEEVDPFIAQADLALEKDSADELEKQLLASVGEELRRRFLRALEKKKHAGESLETGREFVQAYVELMHYIESIHPDHSLAAEPSRHSDRESKAPSPID